MQEELPATTGWLAGANVFRTVFNALHARSQQHCGALVGIAAATAAGALVTGSTFSDHFRTNCSPMLLLLLQRFARSILSFFFAGVFKLVRAASNLYSYPRGKEVQQSSTITEAGAGINKARVLTHARGRRRRRYKFLATFLHYAARIIEQEEKEEEEESAERAICGALRSFFQ